MYSLGALLYTILSYDAPITGASIEDVLKKTLVGEIEFPKEVPTRLKPVLAKAMALKAEDRYQSVPEFQQELA